MRPLPRAAGLCPVTWNRSCRNLLGEEGGKTQAKDAAFSLIISVFLSQKLRPGIVLQGFRAVHAAAKPAQKQNRRREAPKIKKLYMCIRINRSTRECAYCKPPRAPRGCRQARPPGRSQVGGWRLGLRGVRAGVLACFLVLMPPSLLASYFLPHPRTTFLGSRRWAESARRQRTTPRRPLPTSSRSPGPSPGQPAPASPPAPKLLTYSRVTYLFVHPPFRQTNVDPRRGRRTGPGGCPAQVTRTPAGMGGGLEGGCLPLGLLSLPRPQGGLSSSSAQASGHYALPPHLPPRPPSVTLESPETTAHWAMLMACQLSGL